MINAQTYLEHLRRDGARIVQVAQGHVDDPVPSCPGNTVGSLLLHCAGVALFWAESLAKNGPVEPDWSNFGDDALEGFKLVHARLVAEIASHDPDEPRWSWGKDQHARFAYRRMAQEFSIHRWDFEDAVGQPLPIDPTLAADGFEELVEEFGDTPENFDVKGAAERFGGNEERLRFECNDLPKSWTLTVHPKRFDVSDEQEADVTAQGTASDINLFVWGRVPPSVFEVSGDASLLHRWQDRVKI